MKVQHLHGWEIETSQAIVLQKELAARVSLDNKVNDVHWVAGVDISVRRYEKTARGSVVLLSYPDLDVIEVSTVQDELGFPYIPGLLSFREMPVILKAFENLNKEPDLVIVDGQGIAHPRRIGLGAHLGLFLDIPVIGCAKSRLCGDYTQPGEEAGNYTCLTDKEETIGAVLRTKNRVKPVFISPGHRINIENAVKWIMNCCRGYRLPEPTRLAHLAAGGNLPG